MSPTDHQLVETLAATPAEGLRNVDRHLDRMADSARWFDFRFDRDAVLEAVKRMTRDVSESSRIRIVLSRDGGVDVECTSLRPAPERPVRLSLDCEPVDADSPWLRHKTTRRSTYLTRALRHPEADDVVLVNQHGEITETTTATLAARWTVAGGRRQRRRAAFPESNAPACSTSAACVSGGYTVADLQRAEAIAVTSSLRGWREAILVEQSA